MTTHYSEKKDLFPLAGGCACGLIRYQLTLPPLIVHACYCTACQRQTGSAFALNAAIETSALGQLRPIAPSIAGSRADPRLILTSLVPAVATFTDAVPSTHNKPSPKPKFICIPTQSQLGQTVAHCPACHTGMWSYYADGGPHVAYVRVGTLDKPWEVAPDVHIYTRSRQPFLAVNDGKPQFEGYYPSRDALLRDDARERMEVLKPTLAKWREEVIATHHAR